MQHFAEVFKVHIPFINISVPIYSSIIYMWCIMLVLIIFAISVRVYMKTVGFKMVPESKFQNFLEALVGWLYDLVESVMGKKYLEYAPLVGTIGVCLLFSNLFSFTGLPQPTADPSVPIGFALVTFFNIHYQAIKKNGAKSALGELASPFAFMLPINLVVELSVPVSLSMRLFGNMMAGLTIIELVYNGLGGIAFGIFRFVIPIPLHAFFDLFDGVVQTYVFMMLTMVFIKNSVDHGPEH